MGKIVLVHGAWHGGWCWEEVVPGLELQGHQVVCSELHRGTLAADTAAVQRDVDALGGSVVVCGHSYGGAVITGLDGTGIRRLVYLAALMPDTDEGLLSAGELGPPTDLSEALVIDGALCTVRADRLVDVFYADCSPVQQSAAIARLRPQAMATFVEPPGRAAWKATPSTYIVCLEDHAIHPDVQHVLAKRATDQVAWPTSHSPFYSDPSRLVELLSAAAS